METQNQAHPTQRQLAALALGRVKPEHVSRLEEHVSSCADCARFIRDTPRDSLAALLKQPGPASRLSDQSTPSLRDEATLGGATGKQNAAPGGASSVSPTELWSAAPAEKVPSDKGPAELDIPQPLREQTKYWILRLLGRGGMGSVYEAYHLRMDRRVAIKIINSSLVDHPEALKRFDQEVKAAAKLDHPNVARAHDADEFGSLKVLVMEFVPGRSLDKFLAQRGKLTVVEACRVVRQALVGLQHAHERGMVHRDLKPQNLMLTTDGKIKILDFGLAKVASERKQPVEGLTRENAMMGTPHYLAPEQALDAAKADIRADIYSLGCTLYCLLSGRPPFDYDTEMKVLVAHQNERPKPLAEVVGDVPQDLSDLVDRMLAKEPAERPGTPKEAAELLLPYIKSANHPPAAAATGDPLAFLESGAGPPIKTTASGTMPAVTGKRPPWRVWAGAGAALAALGLVGWLAMVLLVRTPEGTIVLEDLPSDIDVQIDGNNVKLVRNDDQVAIEAIRRGDHHLKFIRGGKQVWASDAKIDFGGQQVHVKYVGCYVLEGLWSIDRHRNELVQSQRLGLAAIAFGDRAWTDYDFNVEISSPGTGDGNLYTTVHGVTDTKFRSAAFSVGAANRQELFFRIEEFKTTRIAGQPGFSHDSWHKVRMEVRGEHCRVVLDGQPLFETTNSSFTQGCVGLGTYNVEARFRNLAVTSPDGKTLWTGLPAGLPIHSPSDEPASAGNSRDQNSSTQSGQNTGDARARPSPAEPWSQARFPEAEIISGKWATPSDELVQTGTSVDGNLLFGNTAWTRFNLTFTAKFSAGDYGFKTFFDASDIHTLRMFELGAFENRWHMLVPIHNGRWGDRIDPRGQLVKDQWYDVRLEVRDSDCRCFLNGEELFAGRPKVDVRYTKGRIGFGTVKGVIAHFKNIKVTSDDGNTVLWQGLPRVPGEIASARKVPAAAAQPDRSPPGPPVRRVELLSMIDLSQDVIDGKWSFNADRSVLTCESHENADRASGQSMGKIDIPYSPPQEYELRITFVRTKKSDPTGGVTNVGCGNNRQFHWGFDWEPGQMAGVNVINRWNITNRRENPTGVQRKNGWITVGKTHVMMCRVFKDRLQTFWDDELVVNYPTDYHELSLWKPHMHKNTLGLCAAANTEYKSVELVEITGQGTPLRLAATAPSPVAPVAKSAVDLQEVAPTDVFGRNWSTTTEEMVHTSQRNISTSVLFGDPTWTDYDYRLKARAAGGHQCLSIVFQAVDKNHQRALVLGGWGNKQHGLAERNGRQSSDRSAVKKPGTVEKGRWYEVHVQVRGRTFTCSVDGVELFREENSAYDRGRVGVRCRGRAGSSAHFRDIVVTDPAGKELWRGIPNLTAEPLALEDTDDELSDESQADDDTGEFVSLFNGKNLSGWKTHPSQPGGWRVEKGIIVGEGADISYLYSEQDDYADVHLRAEVRINDSGNSGIHVRTPFGPTFPLARPKFAQGYEAAICAPGGRDAQRTQTGGIYVEGVVARVTVTLAPPGKWFTIEQVARGNEITVLVNGRQTANYVDVKNLFTRGHIALELHDPLTKVEFRKIEVKRLE